MEYSLINPINPEYTTLEQVLTNRGIVLEDISHYLNLTSADNLSPLLLKNIDRAVQILAKHIMDEKAIICIQVDSDCDGYMSASYLANYIHAHFPSAIGKIVFMFHKGKVHGINIDDIPEGTTLVIAPDASSNEEDIHKKLSERGIDVLVMDHHQADKISEYACVVNNQLCDYPNKTLSGVGVVYKVCQRLDELLGESHADDFLDLVACGLVGDMMDIRNMETRYLIQEGLKKVRNPYIKGMVEKNAYSIKGNLTPIAMAFYIVPYINAVTRVGTQEEKKILFDSTLEWKAYDLIDSTKRGCKDQKETVVEQAVRTCQNVKSRQTRTRDSNIASIEDIIADSGMLEAHKLILITLQGMDIDKSITGLMANELMSKYKRPVAILNKVEENGKVAWMGSARGYEKSKMNDFRQFCRDSGLVFLAEGHPNAFGLGIYEEDFEKFVAYSDEVLKDIEFSPSYKVDFIYSASTFDSKAILDLGDVKYLWGQNIEEPLIAIEHLSVTKEMLSLMSKDKNPTLKIQLPNGVSCIKFKSSEEEYESLFTDEGCVTINLVGKPEVNKYFSNVTPQMLVQDYEIINRQEFYF